MRDIIGELSSLPPVMSISVDNDYEYITIYLKGNTIRYSTLENINKILIDYDYYLYSVSICSNHEQLQILGLR